jgi:septum site-determining protein MinC
MLRGTPEGLELVFDGRPFDETSEELWRKLAGRPEFYRGSSAVVILGDAVPEPPVFDRFVARVRDFGIELRGLAGPASAEPLAVSHALGFSARPGVPGPGGAARRAARKAKTEMVVLTGAARSLDADFAGARADLARRRRRAPASQAAAPAVAAVAAKREPVTLYVRGTVRGGQSLQQLGNIVVVGDVNPGAELVASGDVAVFGRLRGTVHAGAQGDEAARVFAVELMPTQLRIAAYIAAEADNVRSRPQPEEAFIEKGRIVVAARGAIR